MSESFVQVPPDSTGKKLRAVLRTISPNDVYEQSVGITVDGALVDPRSIRTLTSGDVVSAVKSGTWNIDNLLNPHPVSLASVPNPPNLDVALSTRATGTILNPHPVSLSTLLNPHPVSLSTLLNPHPVSLDSIPNPSNLDVALSTRATGTILNPHPVSLSTLLNPHPVSLASIPNPSNLDVALSTRATGTIANPHPVSLTSIPNPSNLDVLLSTCATETTLGTIHGHVDSIDTKITACNTGAVAGSVSLGISTGKTNVLKTGNLVTTATTADQVILTYTVTAGKTFYMEYLAISARLTTFATTATFFGASSLENPSATKLFTIDCAGAGITAPPITLWFAEPIPIAAGTVIRVVCTPNSTTSYTWKANVGGYEK